MLRLLLVLVLVLGACGSRAGTPADRPDPAESTAASAAPGACVDIRMPEGRTTPYDAPTLPPPPDGYAYFSSPEGGWRIVHPISWTVTAERYRGALLSSYDPATQPLTTPPPQGGATIPPGQARLSIELWPNDERLDVDAWIDRGKGGLSMPIVHERRSTTIDHQPAIEMRATEQIGPPPNVESRFWFVRSPYFDRVYRIWSWPAASPLQVEVDRMIESLALFPPTYVAKEVLVTEARAIELATEMVALPKVPGTAGSAVERVEAKLVRLWDMYRATGSYTFTLDPDTLIWLVAMSGTFEVVTRGPGGGLRTFHSHAVGIDAHTGEGASGLGYSAEPWMPVFDGLEDRCVRS